MFSSPFKESIIKRAVERGIVKINIYDLRDFTHDRHKITDDYPYGGGAGMIMKPEPLAEAIEEVNRESKSRVILMTPQGDRLTQSRARELSQENRITILCGRYEGIDERIRAHFVDDEISIGDYILTGGEIPAMVLVDAIIRLIPDVLGDEASVEEDSFSNNLLEYPQYTRPENFRGFKVPEILLSGNHEKIRRWRRRESLKRTFDRRLDLLDKAELTEEDKKILEEIRAEKIK
ncbi:MAG: tRNA (guanosine(37)-N1)-methyltransferase TrmD [Nitrospinae bacterium]|nr:tRNA (guanosine(37)-N1)-methyltransferase TrmD [Nitrospinota bacterium]